MVGQPTTSVCPSSDYPMPAKAASCATAPPKAKSKNAPSKAASKKAAKAAAATAKLKAAEVKTAAEAAAKAAGKRARADSAGPQSIESDDESDGDEPRAKKKEGQANMCNRSLNESCGLKHSNMHLHLPL